VAIHRYYAIFLLTRRISQLQGESAVLSSRIRFDDRRKRLIRAENVGVAGG